jgi:hypothetical protein
MERPELGIRPLGYVDHVADAPTELPLLGPPSELGSLLEQTGAATVVLAFGPIRDPELVEHVRRATMRGRRLRVLALPRFYELGTSRGGEVKISTAIPSSSSPHHPTSVRPGSSSAPST